MIKSFLSRLAQGILMIALVYAGSFVVMEETSEKTEKTEKSEEALHKIYHSRAFMRAIADLKKERKKSNSKISFNRTYQLVDSPRHGNFNVDHIYFSSYLDTLV